MKQKFLRRPCTPVVGILYLLVAVLARAGGPTDELRAAIEKVQMTLNDPQLKAAGKKGERLDKLRQVIQPKFDFTEMAKRSLGANWQRRNTEEQREFVKVFTDLLENAYVDSIDSYDGEKVVFTNEKQDKEYGEVNTKIVTKKGEEFSVNYKLHQASGNWKGYDVVIENISIVNNYRAQFNRVIVKSSYEELVRTMKEKRFDAPGKRGKA